MADTTGKRPKKHRKPIKPKLTAPRKQRFTLRPGEGFYTSEPALVLFQEPSKRRKASRVVVVTEQGGARQVKRD